MGQKNWAQVLEAIYENEDYWKIKQSELEDISDNFDIDQEGLDTVLEGLASQDLIERNIDDIKLTQRGFQFISEKKTHDEQMLTQRLLLVFVTALSLSTLVNTILRIGTPNQVIMNVVYSIVFAIIFIVLGMIAKENLN